METLVPAATCHHGRIRVATERAMEFIDLTNRIEALAAEAGIHAGLVNPEPARTVNLATGERPIGHAHCHALLLGSSASLNFAEGRLQLGRAERPVSRRGDPGGSGRPRCGNALSDSRNSELLTKISHDAHRTLKTRAARTSILQRQHDITCSQRIQDLLERRASAD